MTEIEKVNINLKFNAFRFNKNRRFAMTLDIDNFVNDYQMLEDDNKFYHLFPLFKKNKYDNHNFRSYGEKLKQNYPNIIVSQ